MNKARRSTLVRLALLGLAMILMTLAIQPVAVNAATCASIGCGSWQYFGCCGSHLYQERTCCNGSTCCNQFRCTTAPCMF